MTRLTSVLLLMPSSSYRADDFLAAGAQLDIEVIVGVDNEQPLSAFSTTKGLQVDFNNPKQSLPSIVDYCRALGMDANIGTDDESVSLAALVCEALHLPHNTIEAIECAQDKYRFRIAMANAPVPAPPYRLLSTDQDPITLAEQSNFPCVLKPRSLSASRGVIRTDNPEQFVNAFDTISRILDNTRTLSDEHRSTILVEDYIDGVEVALEGLLVEGQLQVLALFDKPHPLTGPYFEETIYVTPSRLSTGKQQQIVTTVESTANVLGLVTGPIHAEARVAKDGVYVLELSLIHI